MAAPDDVSALLHLVAEFPPEVRTDPHPYYHQLRALAPIATSVVDENTALLSRFADCEAVLRDTRWSSNPAHRTAPLPVEAIDFRGAQSDAGASVLLFLDPPDHTRLRKLVNKAFTPRTVERLRPRVRAIVDGILDEAAERGELDIVADLGFMLPVTVICELMGVPVEDHHLFGPWSSDASRMLDGMLDEETAMRGIGAFMQIISYFNDLYADRRANPRDDMLTALVQAEEAGDRLTEEELRSMTVLLFIAGHETTMNLIGNGMRALLDNPDQLARLRDDPTLIGSAVEELLRYDGPVHVTARVATEALEVGGHSFAAGDQVLLLLAAANRDPDHFPHPDRLDVGRSDGPHLTFSHGIHYCLGASLARLEGQIAIDALVQRFPGMERITDPIQYRDHFVLRGLRELRVATPVAG